MKRLLKFTMLILCLMMSPFTLPEITAYMGIPTYAAQKVVDAIFYGASAWTIISLIIMSGGFMAIGYYTLRKLVIDRGKAVAIAW